VVVAVVVAAVAAVVAVAAVHAGNRLLSYTNASGPQRVLRAVCISGDA